MMKKLFPACFPIYYEVVHVHVLRGAFRKFVELASFPLLHTYLCRIANLSRVAALSYVILLFEMEMLLCTCHRYFMINNYMYTSAWTFGTLVYITLYTATSILQNENDFVHYNLHVSDELFPYLQLKSHILIG